jgi:hypothetical protein
MKNIKTVINIDDVLYRYIINNYSYNEYKQIILPKINTGEQFYSASYAERIADIDWESLPFLEIDSKDIIIN